MLLHFSRQLAPGCGVCRNYHARAQAVMNHSVYRAILAGRTLQIARQMAARLSSPHLPDHTAGTQIEPRSSKNMLN